MADRVYDDNPGYVAPSFTRKADGTIGFGKLVEKGTAAGDVKVTAGLTAAVLGVAMPNEVIYSKSGSAQYADGDVVTVSALMPGKIYYLYADGAISEGDFVSASTNGNGDIATISPGAGTSYQIVGIALDDISDNNWGRILVV